eukprot:663880_1
MTTSSTDTMSTTSSRSGQMSQIQDTSKHTITSFAHIIPHFVSNLDDIDDDHNTTHSIKIKQLQNRHMLFSSDSESPQKSNRSPSMKIKQHNRNGNYKYTQSPSLEFEINPREMARHAPLRKRRKKSLFKRKRNIMKQESVDKEKASVNLEKHPSKEHGSALIDEDNYDAMDIQDMHEYKAWRPSRGTRHRKHLRHKYNAKIKKTYNTMKRSRQVFKGKVVDIVCVD